MNRSILAILRGLSSVPNWRSGIDGVRWQAYDGVI